MSNYNISVKLDLCEQEDSHEILKTMYDSKSKNCQGICKKCGEKLMFYIGDNIVLYCVRTLIVNPGVYLLHNSKGYKKINIKPCKNRGW